MLLEGLELLQKPQFYLQIWGRIGVVDICS